ncbi:ABC transporter ATP-binding protein [Marinomonas mediterranea]|jgi:ABC-type sugar transport systems, ATPase components|uniref:Glycerol-3-phosphate-transporting ATPase n=1 Tax=Marinomonas mediterranea (strain ATCC 700492 / JCM 21426 / NBRC 103028 / MMB-1) TaxID=717774 RepID=F2K0A7_MARM1|nr:sn-glycerol-3-phosphate ABC transporter ATP-binding protein UgpC [Marinomonas mediterranea]ADZ89822.1 Glycerol-3-phosphate-transporting ATPase [Marinomonas mediterranea MMB-1]WCN16043.1 sn-glycerol-3-phosphate ABC transporter ATP-binding protein UgpC [Marinomonas mediterranea MMB-1]
MSKVTLEKVAKVYSNGFKAVHDIDLEIQDGEFMVMIGPSGCAKSTTLRMLAGLETISGGHVRIGNDVVNNLAPKDRGIAMVFQNYALYPHMTVRENLGFGLKLAKVPADQIEKQVNEAAEMLELMPLMDRLPRQLSGGQAQRVAVGRAIVKRPNVFLFDEPLSNLDAKLRASMRVRISDLHKQLKSSNRSATTVYVTHDQTEAMTMGDRICVMKEGVIMQVDTPANLYKYPKNLFVAGFIGAPEMNMIAASFSELADGCLNVDFGEFGLCLNASKSEKVKKKAVANDVTLGIRPEFIHLAEEQSAKDQLVKGTIVRMENMGSEYYVYFLVGGQELCARIQTSIVEEKLLDASGKEQLFFFDMAQSHVFDRKTEENLSL